MTREEAIEILKANYPDACFEQLREAVDMAIEALSAQPNLHTACTQLARDIATIIENEKDMRVMLKNAQPERTETHTCVYQRTETHEWIPVTEVMPKDDTEVIVSCTDDSGDYEYSYTTTGWHFNGVWVVGNERSYFVRAWMPLPEPWRGEKK